MQDAAYVLRRITLTRNWVNRGKKKGTRPRRTRPPFALCSLFGGGVLEAFLAVFYSITSGSVNGIPARTTVDDVFPGASLDVVVARTAKELVIPLVAINGV